MAANNSLTILLLPLLGLCVLGSPIPAGPLVGWQPEPPKRGTFGIITSCGVTLGLCVWTAIHPDIMPDSTGSQRFFKKVSWTLKALLIPEEVVSAAADQWVQTRRLHRALVYRSFLAKYLNNPTPTADPVRTPTKQVQFHAGASGEAIQTISSDELDHTDDVTPRGTARNAAISTEEGEASSIKRSKVKSWLREKFSKPIRHFFRECGHGVDQDAFTKEVAFFVVMGGFIRPGGKDPITPEEFLEAFIDDPEGLRAKVSRKDILDKGKASILAKLIVCGQVSWLVVQLIGRQVANLPIALLELHVLIHVIIAAAVYALWWNKQLDVNEPIVLNIAPSYKRRDPYWYKRPKDLRSNGLRGFIERWWLLPPQWSTFRAPDFESERRHKENMAAAAAAQQGPTPPPNDQSGLKRQKTLFKRPTAFQTKRDSGPEPPKSTTPLSETTLIYGSPPVQSLSPAQQAQQDAELSAQLLERQILRSNFSACAFYFIYAGLHATAWKSQFPTRYERWIWRGSCLLVGIVPAILVVLSTIQISVERRMRKGQEPPSGQQARTPESTLNEEKSRRRKQDMLEYSLQAVYLCASTCLLGMSFETLRIMPERAYETVRWSTYIPHV